MTEKIEKITQQEIDIRKIASLPTRPNNPRPYGGEFLSPEKLKERFDALSLLIIDRLNPLIEKINNGEIAKHIPALTIADEEFTLYDLAKKIIDGTLPDIMKVYEDKTLRLVLSEITDDLKNISDVAGKILLEQEVILNIQNQLINTGAIQEQLAEIIKLQETYIGGDTE